MKDFITKPVWAKDIKPLRTLPNRKYGLASGLCTSLCSLIAIFCLLTCYFLKINFTWKSLIIGMVLVEVTASLLCFGWASYARKQDKIKTEQINANSK